MSHARFSPSSAYRWLSCPASVLITLIKGIDPVDKESVHARRGSAIHHICERKLKGKKFSKIYQGESGIYKITPEDILDYAAPYVRYVRKLMKQMVIYGIEKKVKIYGKHCYGTVDFFGIGKGGREIHVVDLKAGAHAVSAVNNSQLKIYAIGVIKNIHIERPELITKKTKIITHIFQPATGLPKTAVYSLGDLKKFYKTVKGSIKNILQAPRIEWEHYNPGSSRCRYCPHINHCPAIEQQANERALDDFRKLV